MPYSFPLLERKEILKCLNELEIGIALTEPDIVKPTMDTIKPAYEIIVQSLVGVTREELQQPVFNAIDMLEFPELHEESIGALAFNRAVTKLMMAAGVHDFTHKDLYKPEHTRTIRNLSAIVNFAKFREEKALLWQDLTEKSEALQERRQHLQEANAQVKSELDRLAAERAAAEPSVRLLEAESQEMASNISALNKQQALLQGEIHQLKERVNEVTDKAQNLKQQLAVTKQEGAQLRSEIVESPELLQRALEDLREKEKNERNSISEAERRSRDLQSKLECHAKVEREVQKCVTMMQEAEAELLKLKVMNKQVKEAKAKISANEEEVQLLAAAQQHYIRQAQAAEDKLQRFESQKASRRAEVLATLEEARSRQTAQQQEQEATMVKISDKEQQIRDIHEKMEEMRATHAHKLSTMVNQYRDLHLQVRSYHAALRDSMEAAPPVLVRVGSTTFA